MPAVLVLLVLAVWSPWGIPSWIWWLGLAIAIAAWQGTSCGAFWVFGDCSSSDGGGGGGDCSPSDCGDGGGD